MQSFYPRKFSPPTRSRTSTRTSGLGRRRSLRNLATYVVAGVTIIFIFLWIFPGASDDNYIPPGTPEVVIVTTIDPQESKTHRDHIMDNRRHYASLWGYGVFFPNTTDYDLMPGVPMTWSKLPAMRHAMTMYPKTTWFWYLSRTALIMNPSESLYHRVLSPEKLESMMIVDQPVVPPDSIIKTFSHLKPERVDFILTQDVEGLSGGSFILRSGEWAKYLLDAWFDPLYRSYNFQKAEGHALEHIVQWHGTILAKLALVPQRIINSYTKESQFTEGLYQEGDFVANFNGCNHDPERNCEKEMEPLMSRWRELRDKHGR